MAERRLGRKRPIDTPLAARVTRFGRGIATVPSMPTTVMSSIRPPHASLAPALRACVMLSLALALTACAPDGARLPGAPQAVAARPLDGAVALSWTLGGDGGSALLNHAYSLDDGGAWTTFDPPVVDGDAVVGALVNGEVHRLRVRALNARGPGAASEPVDAVAARPSYLVAAHAPGHLQVNGIAPQRDAGSLLVGYHYGAASFGSIPPVDGRASEVGFLAKLDADAVWTWMVDLEAGGASSIDAVAPLKGGAAVVVGTFREVLDLDPVASFTSAGDASFVAALDGDGRWLWAALMDAHASSGVEAVAVAVAPDGDVVVAGTLYGTVRFGDTVVSPTTAYDAFVARLAPGGVWHWVASAGADGITIPASLTLAPDGAAVIAGRTRASQPVATLPATGNAGLDDAFVATLDADGATWRWVRTFGGPSHDRVEDVAVADGSIIAVGSYDGTVTFGPLGARPPPFPSTPTAYLLRLSLHGAWERVEIVGTSGGAGFDRVVPRPGGGTVLAGWAGGEVVFPGGVSAGTIDGPYVAVLDASDALLDTRVLVRGDGASVTDGWGHIHALALGVGDVPLVAGSLTGTLSFGGDVVTQVQPSSGPDLFVWKTGLEAGE